MNDQGPVTFEIRGDLGSMECELRGGRAGDILVATLQNLVGPLFPVACWLVLRLFLWAEPTPQTAGGLLYVAGFAVCVGALLGLVWSLIVPNYLRWRVAVVALAALMVGFAGFASGTPAVEAWGPVVVLWVDAVVAAARLALRWATPTLLVLDAHGVTVDGNRMALEGLEVRVEDRDLRVGARRIPMGAHAPWEREWLAERIVRARDAAARGTDGSEERQRLEQLLTGRRQEDERVRTEARRRSTE